MYHHVKRLPSLGSGEGRASSSRSTGPGNLTPRGDGTPRLAWAGMYVTAGHSRSSALGGEFGGSGVLNAAAIDAELDHAELNANHNRRAGQLYINHKRPARRNDHQPRKRARRVTWNTDLELPARTQNLKSATPMQPNASPASNLGVSGHIENGVRRAVTLARESASAAQTGGAEKIDFGVMFLSETSSMFSGESSTSGRLSQKDIEISSAPVRESPISAQSKRPGGISFHLKNLFNFGGGDTPPQHASVKPSSTSKKNPHPVHINANSDSFFGQAQGAFEQISWNPWGNNASQDASGKENRGNTYSGDSGGARTPFSPTKLSENRFMQDNAKSKQGVHTANTSNPLPAHTHIHTPTSASSSRRVSADMQQRLTRYSQAVAAAASPSPHSRPPITPESRTPESRLPSVQRLLSTPQTLSVSTTTPSKTHAAPSTPKQQKLENLEESPTNSQPHTGPVFLRRAATPGKEMLGARNRPEAHKEKPLKYLGAKGQVHSSFMKFCNI